MRSKVIALIGIILTSMALLSGCKQNANSEVTATQKIFFFDETRNELVSEPIGEDFKKQKTAQEKIEYIINRLVENKSTQLATLQNSTPIPYLRTNIADDLEEDPTVKFHFTTEYNNLTPAQKIGMRASIVYSLAELNFINGVDFYVEDTPLMTAVGKTVGVINPSKIEMGVLDPNPAIKPYTLSLYYADDEGKLEKEMRGDVIGDSASIEKLLIEALINGPTIDGLKPTMPSDVKINVVNVTNGVCQVDLSFDTKSKFFTSEEQKELMIYSMVNTLTELPQIKKVVIFLDGKSGIAFTKNIDFGDILERSEDYIKQK